MHPVSHSSTGVAPTVRRIPRWSVLSAGLVAVVAVAGCGSTDEPRDTTATTGTTAAPSTLPPDNATSLTIVVGIEGVPSIATATLSIDPAGVVAGTGYLERDDLAQAAAQLLDNPVAAKRLVEGAPADQMCTEIYGGPDIATVTGTLGGAEVKTTFHRNNGCGISDWELFLPLLTRSHWDGEGRLYLAGETTIDAKVGERFSIELASNPSTGFEWTATVAEPAVVTLNGGSYLAPDEQIPGAGGYERFSFTAAAAGTTTITVEYRRPFDPAGQPAAETAVYTVTVT